MGHASANFERASERWEHCRKLDEMHVGGGGGGRGEVDFGRWGSTKESCEIAKYDKDVLECTASSLAVVTF